MDRKDKAESIIRSKLESNPDSPYLWCLLGDATDDLSCYEKSWTLSNGKYYKAKRAIGNYYFKRKNYVSCIDPYQDSLKLNSLQIDTWNRLAFAALSVEDYNLSVRSYRRFVEFEPDIFEAWNNMSKAYIKLGEKMIAFNTLQEAIKCNYDEWRLWDNYMIVGLDVGAFEEVIRSYHRLIDIKRIHEDDQVISCITDAVLHDVKDMNGNGASRLAPKLVKLLARISSTSYSSVTLFTCLYRLYENDLESESGKVSSEKMEKMIECIKKANRACVKNPEWNKTPEGCKVVIGEAKQTLQLVKRLIDRNQEAKKIINTFKLSYLSIIKATELSLLKWDADKEEVKQVETLRQELELDLNQLIS